MPVADDTEVESNAFGGEPVGGDDQLTHALVGATVGPQHADEEHFGCLGQSGLGGVEEAHVDTGVNDGGTLRRAPTRDGMLPCPLGGTHEPGGRTHGPFRDERVRRHAVQGGVRNRLGDVHHMGESVASREPGCLVGGEGVELMAGDDIDAVGGDPPQAP